MIGQDQVSSSKKESSSESANCTDSVNIMVVKLITFQLFFFITVTYQVRTLAAGHVNYRIPRRGGKESGYTSLNVIAKTKATAKRESVPAKKGYGLNRKVFRAVGKRGSKLQNSKASQEKKDNKKSRVESGGKDMEGNSHADIERLQAQIMKTAMKIDQLYGSFTDGGYGNIQSAYDSRKLNEVREEKPAKVTIQHEDALCNENCCGSAEVIKLRNKLKLEKGVRDQMIRIIAREKLRNERKTKALQAILLYYHPGEEVLRKLSLPARLKRVIINERIKLLPMDKQVEFARRVKKLRRKT